MRPLEDNPAGDSQQSTLPIVKRKRGRPSSSSTSSNKSKSIHIIHWQFLPCKSSNEESKSLTDKKIRKPLHLITADKPNDYTIPTTDVVFAQKFMSITPFKFRGRKPLSVRSSNPDTITSTYANKDDNKEPTIVNSNGVSFVLINKVSVAFIKILIAMNWTRPEF